MKMWLEWADNMVILHILDKDGRTEVRGSSHIFAGGEPVGDPVAMLLSALQRQALDRSALMADEVVSVRKELLEDVRSWLVWHEKVSCWYDGQWIGK